MDLVTPTAASLASARAELSRSRALHRLLEARLAPEHQKEDLERRAALWARLAETQERTA